MKKSCFHKGFDISGEVISDDWEGDPSIPGGVRKIPPYVDGLKVEAGSIDHAAAGNLSDSFLTECETVLTEI